MEQSLYHIYDKIFKKILTLSSTAVVGLINGLFGTNYPPDSTITYNWTEFTDKELKRILADTILTIGGSHSYHLEAQMVEDDDIVFRIFDYGYGHAKTVQSGNREHTYTLQFPEPKIIYLYTRSKAPDHYTLHLDFGSQGYFDYTVTTFQYLESTPQELTDKKMIILIPFELLKLREAMKKERSEENKAKLQSLIQNDIIGSINKNLEAKNITKDDARKLKRLTHKLYEHIYSHYKELKEVTEMTDESIMLDIDIIEKEHEMQLAEKDAIIADQKAEIADQKAEIADQKAEIANLKAQLERYEK